MILKKITLIFSILMLSTSLQANVEEKSINYEKCELEYSLCVQLCDSQENPTEECFEACDIKQIRCEEKEKSK